MVINCMESAFLSPRVCLLNNGGTEVTDSVVDQRYLLLQSICFTEILFHYSTMINNKNSSMTIMENESICILKRASVSHVFVLHR